MSNSQLINTQSASIQDAEDSDSILILEVNIGDGRQGEIYVSAEADPFILAESFCTEHNLPIEKVRSPLALHISYQLSLLEQPLLSSIKPTVSIVRSSSLHPVKEEEAKPEESPKSLKKGISPHEGQRLYYQGITRKQKQEQHNEFLRKKKEALEEAESTLRPRINSCNPPRTKPVTDLLMDKWHKRNQEIEEKREKESKNELKVCTFSPCINPKSQKIEMGKSQNGQRFMHLYGKAKEKNEKLLQMSTELLNSFCPFTPDTKLTSSMNETITKHKKDKVRDKSPESEEQTESFKPQIGRPPKYRDSKPHEIGDHLYAYSKKKPTVTEVSETSSSCRNDEFYNKIKTKKFRRIFDMLRPRNGFISTETIVNNCLPDNIKEIIQPLLDEIIEVDEKFTFEEFYDSLELLLKVLTPGEKSTLMMTSKNKAEPTRYTFTPVINTRKADSSENSLYDRAVKKKQEMEEKAQQEKNMRAISELEECTFRPRIKERPVKINDQI